MMENPRGKARTLRTTRAEEAKTALRQGRRAVCGTRISRNWFIDTGRALRIACRAFRRTRGMRCCRVIGSPRSHHDIYHYDGY